MYRLYKWTNMIPKLVAIEYFEKDIVDDLMYDYNQSRGEYKIIRDIGNGDEFYKSIRNDEDYHNYIVEFQDKMLQELDVIETKKENEKTYKKRRC